MPSWGINHHSFSDDKVEYTAIPIELEDHAIAAIGDMRCVGVYRVAEVIIFSMESSSDAVVRFTRWINENLVPYNYVYYKNDYGYWPERRGTRRFTKGGEDMLMSNKPTEDPSRPVTATLIHMLEGKGVGLETARRLAICYSIDTDWENQVKYGRLYLMRKLMGSV